MAQAHECDDLPGMRGAEPSPEPAVPPDKAAEAPGTGDGMDVAPSAAPAGAPRPMRSLRIGFLAYTLSAVLVIVVAFFSYLEFSAYTTAARQIEEKLTRMLQSQSILLADAAAREDRRQVLLLLAPVLADPDIVAIVIELADGRRLAEHGAPLGAIPRDMVRRRQIMGVIDGEPRRIGWIVAGISHDRIDHELQVRLIEHLVLALLIFLALVVSTQAALQLTVMRPVRRLLAAISGWHAGDTASPVDWKRNDEFGQLIGAFNEMQHRQQYYQRTLRHARDTAEAADRAKASFLAIISHELRTPLNAIIGFADLLRTDAAGTRARRDDYVENIAVSGRKLLELVNDILDITHAQADGLTLGEEPLHLARLVDRAIAVCPGPSAEHGPAILNVVPGDLPPLLADRRRLGRALVHLLSNALHFTEASGSITVDAFIDGDQLWLRVIDTGRGIAEDRLAAIQQPFVQTSEDWQGHSEGTGLGLTYVKTMAERHGGRFVLESRLGKGTTASLVFPATRLGVAHAGGARQSE